MNQPLYLADTNILIDLVAGRSATLRRHVEQQRPGSVITSTLCVAEALFGARSNGQEVSLDLLLKVIEPVAFDVAAAKMFAAVPFGRGRLDRLIAAHALALDLTLVTNNERDFSDVQGLRVENWTR